MDTIRLFLRSNSARNTKKKETDLTATYSRTISNVDKIHNSNNNLLNETEDNISISSEKLSREHVKSFLLTHASSTAVLSSIPIVNRERETCSGISTPSSSEYSKDTIVAASASESVSNARSFTDNNSSKRRRSSIRRRRSWIPEHNINIHRRTSLSSPIRRTKSHRYPHRIRKHTIKTKYGTEKLRRHSIQPFQSTYRQRNEDFRKIFKDLPDDERLIVDYLCALQKDILIQGRMYLSQNYLCFYSNILNWKTSLCLKFKDINSITREKTAKVISNAIEIKLNKGEKFFFASFVTRDKTYTLISRLWQAASTDQPISSQQLWIMIHEGYGDDLDMTTDDEDTYHKSSSDKISLKSQIQSDDKHDHITPNLISRSFQQEDDRSSISSRGEHQTDDENIISIGEETIKTAFISRSQSDLINENTSDYIENYLTECPCQSHLATQLINRTYSMSVEHLFDCIFGDNDFLVAYRTSRRIKDFHASEWQTNNETEKRERLCTYKVGVTAVFGSTTICSNERQVVICELPKSHYIIDTEVRNEGIKYADSFFVASRYCLVQIGPNKSHLKVTCEVRYVKSLMAIIKTFIEKNAMAALQDSFTDLMKRVDQESSKQSRIFNVSNNNEKEKLIQSHPILNKRSSRQQQSNELNSSTNDLSIDSQRDESIQDQINTNLVLRQPVFLYRNTFLVPFCLITMLLLLIINIFLCVKLNQIDKMTDRLVQSYPLWLNKYSYQQEDSEWSSLLKIQEEYYQTQLTNLHSVLITTHNALQNVTNALNQFYKLSSRSS